MRTLIVTEFISLDGVVDSPGGGDHPHAGWTFQDVEFDEAAYEIKGREQKEAGALLFGRQSYDEFAPVWPTMEEFAEYNAMPKYVVSTTLYRPASGTTPRCCARSTRWPSSSRARAARSSSTAAPRSRRTSPPPVWSTATTCWCSRWSSAAASGCSPTTRPTRPKLELVEHAAYANGVQLAVYDVVHS